MSFQLANTIPSVEAEQVMVLAVAAVVAAGIAAGLFYRAGAAIALSLAVLLVTFFTTLSQGWPFWSSVLAAFGLMVALQISYLAGVAIAVGLQKARAASSVRSTLSALFKRNEAG
jgi:hypothetical protein